MSGWVRHWCPMQSAIIYCPTAILMWSMMEVPDTIKQMWSQRDEHAVDYRCLHESGLTFNPDRSHSVSVEIIGDWIIFVYLNPDWVATSGSSSFHFSFRIEHSIRNEMSIRNHVNLDRNLTLEWNSKWNRRSLWPK